MTSPREDGKYLVHKNDMFYYDGRLICLHETHAKNFVDDSGIDWAAGLHPCDGGKYLEILESGALLFDPVEWKKYKQPKTELEKSSENKYF
jgi:hypothetical protein